MRVHVPAILGDDGNDCFRPFDLRKRKGAFLNAVRQLHSTNGTFIVMDDYEANKVTLPQHRGDILVVRSLLGE